MTPLGAGTRAQVGWQMNERNLVWDDDLKVRLIKVRLARGRGGGGGGTKELARALQWGT